MHKRIPLRIAVVLAIGAWLVVTWVAQPRVAAVHTAGERVAVAQPVPQQQSCPDVDLRIQSLAIEPDPPAVDQPYNVVVEITNSGTVTSTVDTWTYLYIDRPVPSNPADPPDLQAFSQTAGLAPGQAIATYVTVPSTFATAGFHSVSIRINALNSPPAESGTCLDNNTGTTPQFLIQGTATPTPVPPTPTPFPPPVIFFFDPGNVSVSRGDSVTLHWQAYGDSVSVTLDGAPVPLEDIRQVTPTESHVYTVRAQNPGGVVERTSYITVLEPTATPTPTPTPCSLATIHEFNATKTTIVRGQETTLFWDLSGATEAFLNGSGVAGVSEKTVTLEQTTIYTLVAHNACGDVQKTLQITVRYATATPTRTPTRTPLPTNTPRPTFTPTRRVLPTPTWTPSPTPATAATVSATPTADLATPPTLGPQTPTITPGVTSTPPIFDSPVTPETVTPVVPTSTAMTPATSTPEAEPTRSLATVTPTQSFPPAVQTPAPTAQPTIGAPTQTPVPTPFPTPFPTQTLVAGTGVTMRMYLVPLGILIVFSIGVLGLSIILPRVQERLQTQDTYLLESVDTIFRPHETRAGSSASMESLFSEQLIEESTAPLELDGLAPKEAPQPTEPQSGGNGSLDEGKSPSEEPVPSSQRDATPDIE